MTNTTQSASPPDTMQAGRSRVYAVSPGRMTLISELRDSETGAMLARVADRKPGRSGDRLEWTTRATNVAAVRRALKAWADALRAALDTARTAAS